MDRETKRALCALLLIFVAAPLIGALLAPHVYQILSSAVAEHPESPFWQWLSEKLSFHRIVSRCVMIMALFMLYPAYRLSGIKSAKDIGLTNDPRKWKLIAAGTGMGMFSMLCFYIPGMCIGIFDLKSSGTPFLEQYGEMLEAILGCLMIGAIEETFFRGILNSLLKRILGFCGALLAGAAIYSLIHFMKPSDPADAEVWHAGLRTLPLLFDRAGSAFIQQALTLFGIGIVLTCLFEYTKSLYIPMGVHAGWVWVMMMFDQFTYNQQDHWLYGESEWISKGWMGAVAAMIILATVIATRKYWKSLARETL